ncbi:MAG: hypothetical protein ABDH28_01880 [Brevinematia bacterium]
MKKILIIYTYNITKSFYKVSKILGHSISYIWNVVVNTKKNINNIARKIAEMEILLELTVGEKPSREIVEKYKQEIKEKIMDSIKSKNIPVESIKNDRKELRNEDSEKVSRKKSKKDIEVSKVSRDALFYLRKFFYEKSEMKESISKEAELSLLKKLLLSNTTSEIKNAMLLYINTEKYSPFFSLKHFCSNFYKYNIPQEKIQDAISILNEINNRLDTKFVITGKTILRILSILEKISKEDYIKAIENLKVKIIETRNSRNPLTTSSISISLLTDINFIQDLINYKSKKLVNDMLDKIEIEKLKREWGG